MLSTNNSRKLFSDLEIDTFVLFKLCARDKFDLPEELVNTICYKGIVVAECEQIGQAFLKLTKEGEQEKVEAMLQEYSWLANYKGNVTDLSERYFAGITGFQCAVWDRDWHMHSACASSICRQTMCAGNC